MQAYDACDDAGRNASPLDGLDAFGASHAAFQALVATLASAEAELLRRLEITKETVIEVLAGGDDDGEVGVVLDPGPTSEGGVGAGSGVSRVGMQVPVFGQDGHGGGRGLPVAYRDVVEVLADAGCRCAPGRCARRWGQAPSQGIGRGCGSSSSGWLRVAGWWRPPRGCSPALLGWLRGWTAAADA